MRPRTLARSAPRPTQSPSHLESWRRAPALAAYTASAGLTAVAVLHAAWATGAVWPLPDREALADAVVGRMDGEFPSPAAGVAVAVLLMTGAACLAGHPRRAPAIRQTGVAVVAAVLATRGALGLAGRTDLVARGSLSPRFRALDRRLYSPLCLALAALSLPTVAVHTAHGPG